MPPGAHRSWGAKDDYIFVFQDIRGRYKSEGQFVMDAAAAATGTAQEPEGDRREHRRLRHDRLAASRTCPNNNGRVGMLGMSYAAGSR